MGNIKELNEKEIELLKFRANMWRAPLKDYQIAVMRELKLLAS